MIRLITSDDKASVIALIVETGLFPPDEAEFLDGMLSDYFERDHEKGYACVVDEDKDHHLQGVAYYAPEMAANGTWNLLLIAVRPENQGKGRGTELIGYVEEELRRQGERILLVETSGLPSFERTRTFYRKRGYEEEARIRDYYETGEDKIVFRKVLNG